MWASNALEMAPSDEQSPQGNIARTFDDQRSPIRRFVRLQDRFAAKYRKREPGSERRDVAAAVVKGTTGQPQRAQKTVYSALPRLSAISRAFVPTAPILGNGNLWYTSTIAQVRPEASRGAVVPARSGRGAESAARQAAAASSAKKLHPQRHRRRPFSATPIDRSTRPAKRPVEPCPIGEFGPV